MAGDGQEASFFHTVYCGRYYEKWKEIDSEWRKQEFHSPAPVVSQHSPEAGEWCDEMSEIRSEVLQNLQTFSCSRPTARSTRSAQFDILKSTKIIRKAPESLLWAAFPLFRPQLPSVQSTTNSCFARLTKIAQLCKDSHLKGFYRLLLGLKTPFSMFWRRTIKKSAQKLMPLQAPAPKGIAGTSQAVANTKKRFEVTKKMW